MEFYTILSCTVNIRKKVEVPQEILPPKNNQQKLFVYPSTQTLGNFYCIMFREMYDRHTLGQMLKDLLRCFC